MGEATRSGEAIRLAFARQAGACLDLGSAFTARLCTLFAERLTDDHAVGRTLLSWPDDPSSDGASVPLRIAGALHALVLTQRDTALVACYPPHDVAPDRLWSAVEAALLRHEAFLLDRLTLPPQTNEVRRSAALLPGFLTVSALFGKPLVLSEIGASAGLNLQWDRYAYRLGDWHWQAQDTTVVLAPDWEGPPPPESAITICERAACDLNPLDPARPEDRLRLLSYIWADQIDRIDRTRAALDLVATGSERVERADAVVWLEKRLANVRPRQAHVVYHTIAWQYLPRLLQQEGDELMMIAGSRATDEAPLARLQMEADGQKNGAALFLQIWPSGEKHMIGRADFHGRWVRWFGWPGI